jgi:hypothetical protein
MSEASRVVAARRFLGKVSLQMTQRETTDSEDATSGVRPFNLTRIVTPDVNGLASVQPERPARAPSQSAHSY